MLALLRRATHLRRAARDERGVVAIEFALVIPIFLLIAYCFMELGRLLFIHNSLGHAVFEAGRYAIVNGSASESPASTADITSVLTDRATGLEPGLISVTVSYDPDNAPGSEVTIVATYAFSFMTTLIPVSDFDLQSETTVVIAR